MKFYKLSGVEVFGFLQTNAPAHLLSFLCTSD